MYSYGIDWEYAEVRHFRFFPLGYSSVELFVSYHDIRSLEEEEMVFLHRNFVFHCIEIMRKMISNCR